MRRGTYARTFAPDPQAPPTRLCDSAGCTAAGEYRAPKSRDKLREYWWFCLEHVRQYNAAWDYYKGMSPAEIEAHLRSDACWQLPTWPLGSLGNVHARFDRLREQARAFASSQPSEPGPVNQSAPPDLREPLSTLGLHWPTTLAEVKARYKELAKRHHPDANGGDRTAEERLKSINLAYARLRTRLAGMPQGDSRR